MPIIPIPVGNKLSATYRDEVWAKKTCEWCGCDYVYHTEIKGESTVDNPLWRNSEGARQQAKREAYYNLEIQRAYPPKGNYRCPSCGRFSKRVAQEIKQRHWWYMYFSVFFGVMAVIFLYMLSGDLATILTIILPLLILALFVLRPKDPNRTAKSYINQKLSEYYPVMKYNEYIAVEERNKLKQSGN